MRRCVRVFFYIDCILSRVRRSSESVVLVRTMEDQLIGRGENDDSNPELDNNLVLSFHFLKKA
jgi:hypothetical protein